MDFSTDRIVFAPDDVDLARSPLRAGLPLGSTFVLGAFNPGLARLPNGNLLLMVRVAEALRAPADDLVVRAIRADGQRGYRLDDYSLGQLDLTDPRTFAVRNQPYKSIALTSMSWLLPVEMSGDGLEVLAVHYDKAIAPSASFQHYGVEDARISLIDGVYYMTACCVSAERLGTCLYTSSDGLNYDLRGLVLDHQNKDMLLFEGKVGGKFWALTRPLGDLYFMYPPESPFQSGPAIHLAVSPDALHWRPHGPPLIRARKAHASTMRLGGGAQPIATPSGWLVLYHGVGPGGAVGAYRTYWALLDRDDPTQVLRNEDQSPLLQAGAALNDDLADQVYLTDIVFTTGIVDAGDHFIVASGELDLACRITHIPKATFA